MPRVSCSIPLLGSAVLIFASDYLLGGGLPDIPFGSVFDSLDTFFPPDVALVLVSWAVGAMILFRRSKGGKSKGARVQGARAQGAPGKAVLAVQTQPAPAPQQIAKAAKSLDSDLPTVLRRLGLPQDVATYNQVLQACARSGALGRSRVPKWSAAMAAAGVKPDVGTYSTLIDLARHAKDVAGAEAGLAEMKAAGLRPDASIYASVMQAHAQAANVDRAEGLLEELRAAGVEPGALHYAALVNACGQGRDARGAARWISEMGDKGIEVRAATHHVVLDLFASQGRLECAAEWVEERMVARGISPDAQSFCVVLDALATAGNIDAFAEWHARMVDHGVQPTAQSFNLALSACARARRGDAAEAWLVRMEGQGFEPDMEAFSSAIEAASKNGGPGSGERLGRLLAMMKARELQADASLYAHLAQFYARCGEWSEIERLRDEMAAEHVQMNDAFFRALLTAYGNSSSAKIPARNVEQAFRAAVEQGLGTPKAVVDVLNLALGRSRTRDLMRECGR